MKAFFPAPAATILAAAILTAVISPGVHANNGGEAPPLHAHRHYTYETIDVPGALLTSAYGINDVGDVVGTFRHPQLPNQFSFNDAFLLRQGRFTLIESPHAPGEKPDTAESAYDVNDAGVVVGAVRPGRGILQAFRHEGGLFELIASPDFEVSEARGITNAGTMTGNLFEPRTNAREAWFLRERTFARFAVPGATTTRVYGINNAEEVVGEYIDAQGATHSFFSRGALIETISRAGETLHTYGINDRGDIVGTADTGEGERGFVLRGDKYIRIHFPEAILTRAYGINSRGEVVGEYQDANGATHGFIASPRHHRAHGRHRDDDGQGFDAGVLKPPFGGR